MGKTLVRVVGVGFTGALIAFAAAPVASAQTDTSTTETSTSTSEPTTSSSTTSTTATSTTVPSSTSGISTGHPSDVQTTEARLAPKVEAPKEDTQDTPKKDDYQDGVGHGFVGLSGEGVLVVACASGKVGAVYTQNLSVTAGPDQDEADGRLWNYTVTVVTSPTGPTGRFAFTCDGVEGIGIVDFEQEQPPTTTSSSPTTSAEPSSTAPVTTTTSAAPGNAAPKAQVKVAPKGGVETGFGGTAW